MAATASITVSGSVIGLPTGALQVGPFTLSSAAANGQTQLITLSVADLTITVPSSPSPLYALIVPPSTNVGTLTYKGIAGDTGIAMSKTNPSIISFAATPPASFVITGGTGATGTMYITFI
jgi:hypothetical protein